MSPRTRKPVDTFRILSPILVVCPIGIRLLLCAIGSQIQGRCPAMGSAILYMQHIEGMFNAPQCLHGLTKTDSVKRLEGRSVF